VTQAKFDMPEGEIEDIARTEGVRVALARFVAGQSPLFRTMNGPPPHHLLPQRTNCFTLCASRKVKTPEVRDTWRSGFEAAMVTCERCRDIVLEALHEAKTESPTRRNSSPARNEQKD